jgi:hypothetical protein
MSTLVDPNHPKAARIRRYLAEVHQKHPYDRPISCLGLIVFLGILGTGITLAATVLSGFFAFLAVVLGLIMGYALGAGVDRRVTTLTRRHLRLQLETHRRAGNIIDLPNTLLQRWQQQLAAAGVDQGHGLAQPVANFDLLRSLVELEKHRLHNDTSPENRANLEKRLTGCMADRVIVLRDQIKTIQDQTDLAAEMQRKAHNDFVAGLLQ